MPRAADTEAPPAGHGIVLLVIVVCWALIRLAFSSSLSGNDDLSVASCALRLLDQHTVLGPGHYCARIGMTVPMAAIFGLAGTGAVQISIVPALASLAALLTAWRLGTLLFTPAVGLVAAAAVAVFPMDVEYAGLAFPDVLQGALVAGALLCALQASRTGPRSGVALAVLAGLLWAWAYYVKLDAFMLAPVLLAALLLHLVRWRHALIMGFVAFALVTIELVGYAIATGDPLLHLHLDSAGANEVLASGMDYRDLLTFPKTMFFVPHEAGLFYFLWLGGVIAALFVRSRAAWLVLAWCLIWQLWLVGGSDPFSGFRLKPQLGRYLLSWQVPMTLLAAWFWTLVFARTRLLAGALAAACVVAVMILGPFNQLGYKAAQATRRAVDAAVEHQWFPLYPDVQSFNLVTFLLRGRKEAADVRVVQTHDFLRGVTRFEPIATGPAYLLINDVYAKRLQERNLVRPIDPTSFGLKPTLVFEVDRAGSSLSYAALTLLGTVSAWVPGELGRKAQTTVTNLLRPGDARIWRLD